MGITYHNQDLVPILKEKDFEVFAHGCNCFCTMGAGIAKQVKRIFPEVYEADCKTEKGLSLKLGTIDPVWVGEHNVVINAYTQYTFWEKVCVDYAAINDCMAEINNFMDDNNFKSLTIPKIGAGLAGGDWDKIEDIILIRLAGKKVNVYYL